jgi:hypothetical protein
MNEIDHFKNFVLLVVMWWLMWTTCMPREFSSGFLLYSYRGLLVATIA